MTIKYRKAVTMSNEVVFSAPVKEIEALLKEAHKCSAIIDNEIQNATMNNKPYMAEYWARMAEIWDKFSGDIYGAKKDLEESIRKAHSRKK